MYTLVIGNKKYSSWSLRPWLLMKVLNIKFNEILIPLYNPDSSANIKKYSPRGLVPILIDESGGEKITIWESLAIIDYITDNHPELPVLPKEKAARGHARSLIAEMHAGFTGLRSNCPMNLGKKFATKDRGDAVAKDVARFEELVNHARKNHGAGGAFLFGEFCAVDAMYAPVCTRIDTYSIVVDKVTRAYIDAILALAAFQEWRAAGIVETAPAISASEIKEEPIKVYS